MSGLVKWFLPGGDHLNKKKKRDNKRQNYHWSSKTTKQIDTRHLDMMKSRVIQGDSAMITGD